MMHIANSTNYSNDITSLTEPVNCQPFVYIMLWIGLFLGILTCFGNLLTIVTVPKIKQRMLLSDMYILSLAVADVFGGIVLILIALIYLTGSDSFLGKNKASCMSMFAIWLISAVESAITILLIAFDRYLYIVRPYLYPRLITEKNIKISIGISWTASLCFGCVCYVWNRFDYIHPCEPDDLTHELFHAQLIFFVICFMVVCICYWNIIVLTRTKLSQLKFNLPSASGDISTWRSNIKSTKLFISVSGTFFFCWFPYLLVTSLKHHIKVRWAITNFVTILAMLNSGMNVIIYSIMNPRFRGGVKSLLKKPQVVPIDDNLSYTEQNLPFTVSSIPL